MKIANAKKRIVSTLLSLLLIISILINMAGCATVHAADLMEGVRANSVTEKTTNDQFIDSSADFAVKLFQETAQKDKSSLISPLSVMLALAMTANGADGQTKAEMASLLGGKIPLDTLNQYLYTYVKNLPSEDKCKLNIANSIWFRDNESLKVEANFLQKNADYYNAAAYKSDFDDRTLRDINNWVKQNTDGTIDKILDKISNDDVMYLINALVFDAEWQTVYDKNAIYDGTFTAIDGTKQNVKMMHSSESRYISDGKASGFSKSYKNNKYSFVALLPNVGISLDDYISSMSGEGFVNAIKNSEQANVTAKMPKFSYDYTVTMNDALGSLGMPTAFKENKADFSKLGNLPVGNFYISEVLHKTYIKVDERGTKAGAVTKVKVSKGTASTAPQYSITLDRPFVYAIVDTATNLPLFIGAVMKI